MTTITLSDAPTMTATSSVTSTGKLQLSIDGTPFDILIDAWDPTPQPPSTTRLTVMNLSDGTVVTTEWQPWSGGPWTPFVRNSTGTGSYFDFQTPAAGITKDIRLQASTPTLPAVNPKLVLLTKTSRDR
jgi:hypothetical protein